MASDLTPPASLWACPPIQVGDQTFRPQVIDAPSRIQRVRACTDVALLRAALGQSNLQKTVCQAIERRLRELS